MKVYTVYQPVTAVYGCGQLLAAKAIQSRFLGYICFGLLWRPTVGRTRKQP